MEHPLDFLNPNEKKETKYTSHIFADGLLIVEYEGDDSGCLQLNVNKLVDDISVKYNVDYDGYGICHMYEFTFKIILFCGDKEAGYSVNVRDNAL